MDPCVRVSVCTCVSVAILDFTHALYPLDRLPLIGSHGEEAPFLAEEAPFLVDTRPC